MDLPHVLAVKPTVCLNDSPTHPINPQLARLEMLKIQVHTVLDHLAGTFEGLPSREWRRHRGHRVVLPPRQALLHCFDAQVEQLQEAEDKGDKRCHQHEPDDYGLFRRSGEEAVHLVWAGEAGADVSRVQGEAV